MRECTTHLDVERVRAAARDWPHVVNRACPDVIEKGARALLQEVLTCRQRRVTAPCNECSLDQRRFRAAQRTCDQKGLRRGYLHALMTTMGAPSSAHRFRRRLRNCSETRRPHVGSALRDMSSDDDGVDTALYGGAHALARLRPRASIVTPV